MTLLEKTILLTAGIVALSAVALAIALHFEFKKPISQPHPELPRTSVSSGQIFISGDGTGTQQANGIIHGWNMPVQKEETQGIWLSEESPTAIPPSLTISESGIILLTGDDGAPEISFYPSGSVFVGDKKVATSRRGYLAMARIIQMK